MNKSDLKQLFHNKMFPLSSKYDPKWIVENEMGPHPLWLTESLTQVLPITKGIRILDLGCGKAMTSIFLTREFGAEVWATDLWVSATDNHRRILDEKLGKQVYPIYAEAHALPFAHGFFDAIVSMDSYHYFGTDVHYIEYITKFLKPGGYLGIVAPASPVHLPLPNSYLDWMFFMNSIVWWKYHWNRFPGIEVKTAEAVPMGWKHWLQWENIIRKSKLELNFHNAQGESAFIALLEKDRGKHLGFVRMVGRKTGKDG
jgi:ubiquinone/menaquinone biosynthesis C-methylase UbiE